MDAMIDNSIMSPTRQVASVAYLSGWLAQPACVQQVKVGSMASTYEGVVGDRFIRELGQLDEDWDGYGAASIDAAIISRAREIYSGLLRYLPAPDINPNSNGTISFEWSKGEATAHLEIGLHSYSFYLSPSSGQSQYAKSGHSPVDMQYVAGLIADQLYSGATGNYSIGNFTWWESSVYA